MSTAEDVLRAAREIQNQLPELLADNASLIHQPLLDLLTQADSGQDVDNQILELLASQESTRLWVAEFLKQEDKRPKEITKDIITRGFSRPPGNISPPHGNGQETNPHLYACPQPGCNYTWERSDIAEPVETCPFHDCELVQKMSLDQDAD